MRERFGESRYLTEVKARVLDVDTRGNIIRALMQDDEGRKFLVGSDGSTDRVYYMESVGDTCSEAHSFLCGFDESRIIAES